MAAAAAVEKGGSAARYACRPVTEQVMDLYGFDKGCTESCAPGKVIEQVWKIWGLWAVGVSQEAGPAGMESAELWGYRALAAGLLIPCTLHNCSAKQEDPFCGASCTGCFLIQVLSGSPSGLL